MQSTVKFKDWEYSGVVNLFPYLDVFQFFKPRTGLKSDLLSVYHEVGYYSTPVCMPMIFWNSKNHSLF